MNNENKKFDAEMRTIFSSFLPLKIHQIKIMITAVIYKHKNKDLKYKYLKIKQLI